MRAGRGISILNQRQPAPRRPAACGRASWPALEAASKDSRTHGQNPDSEPDRVPLATGGRWGGPPSAPPWPPLILLLNPASCAALGLSPTIFFLPAGEILARSAPSK